MTTALIITSGKSKDGTDSRDRFAYVQEFCDAVEAKVPEARVCFTTYEDIIVTVRSGHATIYDTRNDLDLRTVAFVHFKNWVNDMQTAGMIARYLEAAGISFYNSEVIGAPARTKAAQMLLLARNGITVPDSFFAGKDYLVRMFATEELPQGFELPLIVKANDGSKGNNNHLVTSAQQAVAILKEADDLEFIVQAYHENEGDYRFLYVGLDEEPMVFLRKGSGDTHLNNTSQGGTGDLVSKEQVPAEYYDIARRAAQITGREIGGVDILVDKHTGTPYVLEVNQTPALATGYGVAIKVDKFAALVEQHSIGEEE